MDSILPALIITAVNIIGWVAIRIHTLGRMNEKVERHDKLLSNGLPKEINDLKNEVSRLDGTVRTYIDMKK